MQHRVQWAGLILVHHHTPNYDIYIYMMIYHDIMHHHTPTPTSPRMHLHSVMLLVRQHSRFSSLGWDELDQQTCTIISIHWAAGHAPADGAGLRAGPFGDALDPNRHSHALRLSGVCIWLEQYIQSTHSLHTGHIL